MDYPGQNGTLRSHLLQLERISKIRDPLLDEKHPIPSVGKHVWEVFWTLNRTRSGPSPISNLELHAWCSLMGEELSRWEVLMFGQLDSAFLDEVNKKVEQEG